MSVSLSLSVCAQWTGQSDQFKVVKATDFKFDVFQGTVWTRPLTFFLERGICKNSLGRDMHSHERLLVV